MSTRASRELPGFLPEYYAPAFVVDGVALNHHTHSTTNGLEQWQYVSKDQSLWLSVELLKCDTSQSKAVFNNLLSYLDSQAGKHVGHFNVVEEWDAYATVMEGEVDRHYFVFRLSHGIQIWTYSVGTGKPFPKGQFESIKYYVNQLRYADARKEGNVAMGKWGDEMHDYASVLLQTGKKKEALSVAKPLL